MSVQTPEGKVKDFVKKYMIKTFPGAWVYSPPGSVFGRAGTPDLLYLWRGVMIAIEVKSDVGKLQDSQKHQLELLAKNGAVSAVIYGKDKTKLSLIHLAVMKKLEEKA